jgi:hypothetical protein
VLKPLDDCEVFFFVNISKVPWVGSSPNGSNITFGFPQILGLKSNELISSDVAGTLQGDQQILDIARLTWSLERRVTWPASISDCVAT